MKAEIDALTHGPMKFAKLPSLGGGGIIYVLGDAESYGYAEPDAVNQCTELQCRQLKLTTGINVNTREKRCAGFNYGPSVGNTDNMHILNTNGSAPTENVPAVTCRSVIESALVGATLSPDSGNVEQLLTCFGLQPGNEQTEFRKTVSESQEKATDLVQSKARDNADIYQINSNTLQAPLTMDDMRGRLSCGNLQQDTERERQQRIFDHGKSAERDLLEATALAEMVKNGTAGLAVKRSTIATEPVEPVRIYTGPPLTRSLLPQEPLPRAAWMPRFPCPDRITAGALPLVQPIGFLGIDRDPTTTHAYSYDCSIPRQVLYRRHRNTNAKFSYGPNA
jgi:hypothetical protein